MELSVLTFEGRAFESNVKLEYNIPENVKMKMDENSIKQLIEILLDNAIKHAEKGSIINVNLVEESNNITILVKNKGDSFYITNTTATINLTNNTIVNNDTTGNFLRAKADSWGKSGSNGGNVTINMTNQKATGNIVVDNADTTNSNIDFNGYKLYVNGTTIN